MSAMSPLELDQPVQPSSHSVFFGLTRDLIGKLSGPSSDVEQCGGT
jgi:hypothetical protein